MISLILPIHDQEPYVARIVDGYLESMDKLDQPFEILLVANGCSDGSERTCRELAGSRAAVRSIELEQGGWGRAVKAGLAAAGGDTLCYTNSARTPPETLILMLLYARAYPDVVLKANRRIRDNWRRRLGSLLYNLECRALFDVAAWDINGTPKVFPRAFGGLLELTRDDDLIDAELIYRCSRLGYPIVEVPILATTRVGGKSTTNYASAVRMYVGAYRLARGQRSA